ncbi:MAG: membrane protein insertion efficiency factor YidD [Fibrobacter sp.]|nr:membrane protein insertion efficiency factor YidD [Fibrobacter sp.]
MPQKESSKLSNVLGGVRKVAEDILIAPIRIYQKIHPYFFHGVCRFHPTCSQYAIEAIRVHGIFKGLGFAIFRILRCNPFCKGGFDPVPPKKEKK